jgi:hypothetical protein
VLPSRVVEHLDRLDDVVPCLLTRFVVAMRRPLAFETAEKSLGHGIVETLACTTHTAHHSMIFQQTLIGVTGLLTAPIRMMHEAGRGTATPQRHLPRILGQRRAWHGYRAGLLVRGDKGIPQFDSLKFLIIVASFLTHRGHLPCLSYHPYQGVRSY